MTTTSAERPRFSASVPYAASDASSVRTCSAPTMERSASTKSEGSRTNPDAGREELEDALRSALELLHRRRVGDAEEAGGVECFARRHRHVRLVEERGGELGRRPIAVRRQVLADVGEQIERARRFREPDARIGREPLAEPIAAAPVFV